MKKSTKTAVFLPVLISGIISLSLYLSGFLNIIENKIYENESFLTIQRYDSDIVIVEIDHVSLQQLPGWPWPRRHFARALRNLLDTEVKNIFFDIDFSAGSNIEDDNVFSEALKAAGSKKILMPSFLQYSDSGHNKYLTLIKPNEKFSNDVTAVSVNLQPDPDGLVRHITILSEFAGEPMPTAATLFSDYNATINESIRLDFSISPKSFRRVSFHNIYNNSFDRDVFKGKHVIIGATALELSDQIPLPIYKSIAGPVVQAIAYQTVANGIISSTGKITTSIALAMFSILIFFTFNAVPWKKGLFRLVMSNTLLLVASFILHTKFNLLFSVSPFILLSSLSYIFLQLAKLDKQFYTIISQRLALDKKEEMMSHVISNTSEGIILLDKKFVITTVNHSAEVIFATTKDVLVGQDIQRWVPNIQLENIINNNNRVETNVIRQQGDEVAIALTLNKIQINDESIHTLFLHDITERKKQEAILTHQATHDSLTGLFNRRHLAIHIDRAINYYHDKQIKSSFVLIDLNNFKKINDTLGHNTGDQVLIALSQRLSAIQDDGIIVARLGGDEFGVLINDISSSSDINIFIDEIQNIISTPIEVSDMSLTIDAAIGVACIPEHGKESNIILMASDVAMYKSKSENISYCIYNPDSDYNTKRNFVISNDVKRALSDNQFQLYFQPKIDFNTNLVVSMEALIRWQHPELGLIGPDEFIPIVENSTLIKPVTLFTMKAAIVKQKELKSAGIDITVAVNLSAKLLDDFSLCDDILDVVKENDVQADTLILEITESAAMSYHENTLKLLNKMVENKLKLSIDDFGTSHASFSYLKQLPVSELKIDKLFISHICHDDSDKIITESIITLAHGLGMRVVAEGIEDKQTYDYLSKLGCDVAQGYWMSKPLPGNELIPWINNWNEINQIPEKKVHNRSL